MNLLNSCQAITYTLLLHQPYHWYAAVFVSLLLLKTFTTLLKADAKRWPLGTHLPQKAARIFTHHHFPLKRVHYLTSSQSLAFTSGFWQPQIYLSRGLIRQLSHKQLEAVILHEIYHARHFHPLKVAISKVINSVLALLPVVDDIAQFYLLTLETHADRFAQSHQHSTRYLRRALSKVMVHTASLSTLGFNTHPLDQRLECLFKGTKPVVIFHPLKVVVTLGVILSSFWYVQKWHAAKAFETEYDLSGQCRLSECITNCVNETWFTPAPLYSVDSQN